MRKLSLRLLLLLALSPAAYAACDPNIPADLSGDCKVDFNDFAMMASDWLTPSVPHEWVARYSGPGDGTDYPYAIAVDSQGNVYVAGYSHDPCTSDDYLTIKYSPDSNHPVWVDRYNGPANTEDQAYAIAIDSTDNIYVTGASYSSQTNRDYATIKYAPDSNEPVWVARYSATATSYDFACAIAIDSYDNIYVTGGSSAFATNYDYATVKYASDSNQPVWVARYNGPANGDDEAWAIAVSNNDNIYVTGYSTGSGTSADYTTIKYSPDSNQPVWLARYNGPANEYDYPHDIAVDTHENIYVTGRSHDPCGFPHHRYATLKYAPDSNQPVWVDRLNTSITIYGHAHVIAIDSQDNIYVTGGGFGSGIQNDYVTVRYSPDSNQPVWTATYNGPANAGDYATAIAVDSNDNIYVTGTSAASSTGHDCATLKYSPDSNQPVWVARYSGAASPDDYPHGIVLDSNDHVYTIARSLGTTTGYDYATIKYSPDYSCTPQITGDFDHNCTVDIYDLEIFCRSWLECNLDPPQDCWQ